jgi:tRNA A-37 threonylcarbamoyl transferase component Bud32
MKTETADNLCPQCGSAIPVEAPQGLCPKCVLAGAAAPIETVTTPAHRAPPPPLETVQAAFPQLEILELIGAGGMGVVFKARQPKLDRLVALKLLPEAAAKSPAFAERFNREARTLARLNHPNIVTVFDFGQAGGLFYLLMEFVDGVNLRQAMRAGRFSPAEALSIVPKICEALQYAHDEGILHRDIKPENILLDAKGRVKIADFGIAKLVGDDPRDVTLTASGASLGTPHYMAPEQIEQPGKVDHRADIYSLGVVFYEMLTGELPIGRFAAPSTKATLDERVDEIVFRALAKERELRQQSAGQMKTEVETVTAGGAKPPPPTLSPAPEKIPDSPGQTGRMVIGGILLTVGVLMLLYFALIAAITLGRDKHMVFYPSLGIALGFLAIVGATLSFAGYGLLQGRNRSGMAWRKAPGVSHITAWVACAICLLTPLAVGLVSMLMVGLFMNWKPDLFSTSLNGTVLRWMFAILVYVFGWGAPLAFSFPLLRWGDRRIAAKNGPFPFTSLPRWVKPATWFLFAWALLNLLISVWKHCSSPPNQFALNYDPTILLLVTCFAMWKQSPTARFAAVILAVFQIALVIISVLVAGTGALFGILQPGFFVTRPANSIQALMALASIFSIVVNWIVLWHPDVRRAFGILRQGPHLPGDTDARTASPASAGAGMDLPPWSKKAMMAAALIAFSLLLPLILIAGRLAGMGGVGAGEAWLVIGLLLALGLPGTVLGCLALSDLREANGKLRGVPLAIFAALTWPLLCLLVPAMFFPWVILTPVTGSRGVGFLRLAAGFILPAGALTFALWAVYATARWAARIETPHKRGMLKWFFLAVLVCGIGLLFTAKVSRRSIGKVDQPARIEDSASAAPATPSASLSFTVPAGQVATFVPVFWSNGVPMRVAQLSAHAVAPASQPVSMDLGGKITWKLWNNAPAGDERLSWEVVVSSDAGGRATSGGILMPREFDLLTNAAPAHLRLSENSTTTLWLMRTNQTGFGVSLEAESQDYLAKPEVNLVTGRFGTGTNWVSAAEMNPNFYAPIPLETK